MSFEQIIGIVLLVLGLLSIVAYIAYFAGVKLPISFWKLKPMQDRFGKIPGTFLHFLSYVIAPIVFGILLILGYRL